MSEGWIIFGLCVLTLIGATLPLLHEPRSSHESTNKQSTQENRGPHGTPPD